MSGGIASAPPAVCKRKWGLCCSLAGGGRRDGTCFGWRLVAGSKPGLGGGCLGAKCIVQLAS